MFVNILLNFVYHFVVLTLQMFTCLKSTMETLEKRVKYVQS